MDVEAHRRQFEAAQKQAIRGELGEWFWVPLEVVICSNNTGTLSCAIEAGALVNLKEEHVKVLGPQACDPISRVKGTQAINASAPPKGRKAGCLYVDRNRKATVEEIPADIAVCIAIPTSPNCESLQLSKEQDAVNVMDLASSLSRSETFPSQKTINPILTAADELGALYSGVSHSGDLAGCFLAVVSTCQAQRFFDRWKTCAGPESYSWYMTLPGSGVTRYEIGVPKPQMSFQLGQQPHWANVDSAPCRDGVSFVEALLQESPEMSLSKRGYAVVELSSAVQALYEEFYCGFETFCKRPREERANFASLQFDSMEHSPNQYHGYSEVPELKCQFMMRIQGGEEVNPRLMVPSDFQHVGKALFQELDNVCRSVEQKVVKFEGPAQKRLASILDPVPSGDLPPRYVSSSILDCFYYFGHAQKGDKRFFNNHAAHTDSGLLTLVVATDEPALEVLDQQLGEWVQIDRAVHQYCASRLNKSHRSLAILMWSDSVEYLNLDCHQPCLHRVQQTAGCKPRISIVFKQRTTPLHTPPRYQEDYDIAIIQSKALDGNRFNPSSWTLALLGASAVGLLTALLFVRK